MVFEIKCGVAILIKREFFPTFFQKLLVIRRFDVPIFLCRLALSRGAVTLKGKNINVVFHHNVDYFGNIGNVGDRNGSHYGTMHSGISDKRNGGNGGVKTTGLAKKIVSGLDAVDAELAFFAAEIFKAAAHFAVQVKRIAHYRKRNPFGMYKVQQIPKTAVQNRVAPCNIKVGQPFHFPTHRLNVVKP